MSQTNFVFNVEVSCEENLSEMYGGMTLQMALVKPSNELVVCKATFPASKQTISCSLDPLYDSARGKSSMHSSVLITEGLRPYLKVAFKRQEGYTERLADDILEVCTCGKDYARVALMLYESRCIMNMPRTFTDWYKRFCRIVGCEFNKNYRKGALDYSGLRGRFFYIEDFGSCHV